MNIYPLKSHTNPTQLSYSYIYKPTDDPAVNAMCEETEESKKVSRIGGRKYFAVFRKRHEAELLAQTPPLVNSLFC